MFPPSAFIALINLCRPWEVATLSHHCAHEELSWEQPEQNAGHVSAKALLEPTLLLLGLEPCGRFAWLIRKVRGLLCRLWSTTRELHYLVCCPTMLILSCLCAELVLPTPHIKSLAWLQCVESSSVTLCQCQGGSLTGLVLQRKEMRGSNQYRRSAGFPFMDSAAEPTSG